MRVKQVLFYIFLALYIAINTFIIVEAAMVDTASASQSMGFTQAFIDFVRMIDPNSPIVTDPETTHSVIRKLVGHFGLFGVSGIITLVDLLLINDSYSWKKKFVIIFFFASGLVFAFASELVQLFTPGRAFAITDVLIDYSGYLLFGGITFLIYFLIQRKKKKKEQ